MNILLMSLGLGAFCDFVPLRKYDMVGFIGNAGDVYADASFVARDRETLSTMGYAIVDIDLRTISTQDFADCLETLDAVFVAGGNTFYLMSCLRNNGLADVLVEHVKNGLRYIGTSAGAVIAGPSLEPVMSLDDISKAPHLKDLSGLGLVSTVVLPHFDPSAPAAYEAIVEDFRNRFVLVPLQNDEALQFVDDVAATKVPSSIT